MSTTRVVQTGQAHYAGFLPDTTQAAEFAKQRSKLKTNLFLLSHSLAFLTILFCITIFFCFFYKSKYFLFTCFKTSVLFSLIINTLRVNIFTSRKAFLKSCEEGKMYRKIMSMILCYMIYVLTFKINS